MRTTTAAAYLMKELDTQRTTIIDSITTGRLDRDEYMRLCGNLQGIAFAKQLLVDLARQHEEGEDE